MKEEVLAIILVPNMIYFERVLRSKATLESRKQLQTKPNTYGVQVHGALINKHAFRSSKGNISPVFQKPVFFSQLVKTLYLCNPSRQISKRLQNSNN